jgi:hypothetical protein
MRASRQKKSKTVVEKNWGQVFERRQVLKKNLFSIKTFPSRSRLSLTPEEVIKIEV